ncbi:unnamed protein product [Cylicocyclus nassatus]|uniref:Uncharacterized protein n=1 Tax=Cylicocyclus nassatus TaxID=53992 RepID=A0AA36H1Y4_CYLNA|nr:unnamed protein product [Cylicocyclus nassatus]
MLMSTQPLVCVAELVVSKIHWVKMTFRFLVILAVIAMLHLAIAFPQAYSVGALAQPVIVPQPILIGNPLISPAVAVPSPIIG